MALRQFVVRTAPLTHEAMIVDATSRDNGRLLAIVAGKEIEIGMDTYMASGSVDIATAEKIVHSYAQQNNIPETEVKVRVRLPKTNVQPRKARKTNDVEATNLTLVKSDKEPVDGNNLTALAQAMVDAHNKRKDDVKPEATQEEQKASAEKPEGAVVKRSQGEKKRAYQKKDKERSARSKAAYERYVKEISQHVADNPSIMEPVVPGPGVSAQDVSDAEFQFALKLAKLLKGVM
jgi:hypothetical protein